MFFLTIRKERGIIHKNFEDGLVAQLGAHHIRIVGVEGSNPFKSTMKKAVAKAIAFFNEIRSFTSGTLMI